MAKGKRKHAAEGLRPLDDSPSHLMHRVLQIALDIYAEEAGPGAPTQRQYAVLAAVADNEGLTQTDLVNATGIDRSTLADLVARMMGKGLLARERSATDGRANTVRLSSEGRAALDAARPRVEAADRRILSLIPRGKRDSLMKILGELAREGEQAGSSSAEAAARKAEKARRKLEREAARLARKARKAKKAEAKAEKADRPGKALKRGKTPKSAGALQALEPPLPDPATASRSGKAKKAAAPKG
ncbi:MAG: MarR family transcriptional regulator [Caulobacteraceae bacterium]|nr:MarR family transcriptional regulator [Caulobacteraceae bacterium]